MTFIFRNKTIFWDISKWNRGQKKWDGGSISFSIFLDIMIYWHLSFSFEFSSRQLHTTLWLGCSNEPFFRDNYIILLITYLKHFFPWNPKHFMHRDRGANSVIIAHYIMIRVFKWIFFFLEIITTYY